jgi:peptide/nickel transport system permease protein
MLLIILRRLGQSIFVLFLVAFISFMIFRYVGNPVDNLLGQEATTERREALIEAHFPMQREMSADTVPQFPYPKSG